MEEDARKQLAVILCFGIMFSPLENSILIELVGLIPKKRQARNRVSWLPGFAHF
jgi:hypothetical protein